MEQIYTVRKMSEPNTWEINTNKKSYIVDYIDRRILEIRKVI